MATVTIQLNAAQAEPAPQDFVTLSARLSDLPGARRDPHWSPYDRAGFSSEGGRTQAGSSQSVSDREAPVASSQSTQSQATAAAGLQGTDAATSNTSNPSTPAQQLSQLDRTLQELGIDPQSISLFHRMAMLLYANNPAALKDLVQQLPKAAELLTSQASSLNSANQFQPQTTDQIQTQNAASSTVGIKVAAAQFSLTEVQGMFPGTGSQAQGSPADQPADGNSAASATTQTGGVTIRLEELQISLTRPGGQASEPVTISVGSSNPNRNSLDVTA